MVSACPVQVFVGERPSQQLHLVAFFPAIYIVYVHALDRQNVVYYFQCYAIIYDIIEYMWSGSGYQPCSSSVIGRGCYGDEVHPESILCRMPIT